MYVTRSEKNILGRIRSKKASHAVRAWLNVIESDSNASNMLQERIYSKQLLLCWHSLDCLSPTNCSTGASQIADFALQISFCQTQTQTHPDVFTKYSRRLQTISLLFGWISRGFYGPQNNIGKKLGSKVLLCWVIAPQVLEYSERYH